MHKIGQEVVHKTVQEVAQKIGKEVLHTIGREVVHKIGREVVHKTVQEVVQTRQEVALTIWAGSCNFITHPEDRSTLQAETCCCPTFSINTARLCRCPLVSAHCQSQTTYRNPLQH